MQTGTPWEQTFLKCYSKLSSGNPKVVHEFQVRLQSSLSSCSWICCFDLQKLLADNVVWFVLFPISVSNHPPLGTGKPEKKKEKKKRKRDNFVLHTVGFGNSDIFSSVSISFWLQALILHLIGSKIRLNSIMHKMGKCIYPGSFVISACCGISSRWLHSMHCWIMQITDGF